MKKGVQQKISGDNSFGIASVILGILSITLVSLNGIILGVIALIFSNKQDKIHPNKWSRSGKILSIIGIALSVLIIVIALIIAKVYPELFANLGTY